MLLHIAPQPFWYRLALLTLVRVPAYTSLRLRPLHRSCPLS